jgi:hypothetical protein
MFHLLRASSEASVTGLGEISPFGRHFCVGRFFTAFLKSTNHFTQKRVWPLIAKEFSTFLMNNFFTLKSFYSKTPFWAIFEQGWAILGDF